MLKREEALTRMREAGLRVTPQRRAVVDALVDDRTHPSADEVGSRVVSAMPGVSLSTVYKTLHELASLGLVRELELPGSMRFDPDTGEHAHLLCEGCGTVVDVPMPAGFPEAIHLPAGVRIEKAEITLRGRCASCASRSLRPS